MSKKRKDDKNRWRNKHVGVRMSPEEAKELDKRWKLCGAATKQDYILESLMKQSITAKGNPMMLTQFRRELREILVELKRIHEPEEMDEELLTPIRTMLEILEAFHNERKG